MTPKLLSAIMLFVAVVFLSTTWSHGQDQTAGQKPKPPVPAALEQAQPAKADKPKSSRA